MRDEQQFVNKHSEPTRNNWLKQEITGSLNPITYKKLLIQLTNMNNLCTLTPDKIETYGGSKLLKQLRCERFSEHLVQVADLATIKITGLTRTFSKHDSKF